MSETVQVIDRGLVGMVTLRGALDAEALGAAVHATTGCALPDTRRVSFIGDNAVAWMSPDELLILCPHSYVRDLVAKLDDALRDVHHLAVDVSDARSVFRISGPGAREVIAKGAPVDLGREAFGPGDLRRTRLGQVAAAFWMVEEDVFDLICFRSVGGFAADWLKTAALPRSLPVFL